LIRYIYNTKVNFKKYLERPDDKQSIVTAFQEDYNQMDDDLRYKIIKKKKKKKKKKKRKKKLIKLKYS